MKREDFHHLWVKGLLLFKGLLSRSILLIYGCVAVWRVTITTNNNAYWLLLMTLVPVILEMIYLSVTGYSNHFKWISPNVMFFLMCVIPCIWIMELTLLDERLAALKQRKQDSNITASITTQQPVDEDDVPFIVGNQAWALALEQILIFALVLAKWIAPKGRLSLDDLSQLLVVYISVGVDIVELFGSFEDEMIRNTKPLVVLILLVWSWSLIQFVMVFTATKVVPVPEDDFELIVKIVNYFKFANPASGQTKTLAWSKVLEESKKSKEDSKKHSDKRMVSAGSKKSGRSKKNRPFSVESDQKSPLNNVSAVASNGTSSVVVKRKRKKIKGSEKSIERKRSSELMTFWSNVRDSKNKLGVPDNNADMFMDAMTERDAIGLIYQEILKRDTSSPRGSSSAIAEKGPVRRRRKKKRFRENLTFYEAPENFMNVSDNLLSDVVTAFQDMMASKQIENDGSFPSTVRVKRKRKAKPKSGEQNISTSDLDLYGYDDDDDIWGFLKIRRSLARNFNCFCFYNEIWAISLSLLCQDIPFFMVRALILIYYQIVTRLIILFTFKNFLSVLLVSNRIRTIYVNERKSWMNLMERAEEHRQGRKGLV